ncbi:hypothetical protein R3P38DRAFT_3297680 [Favolaschia claudopus]|uniref:Uncharacterized protein n=1 Tax=Favolaschia claudopus TaxID=2862362 RepID=A0AAV9Z5U0_9AGAR
MASSSSELSEQRGECTAYEEETKEECTCSEFRPLKKTGLCANCFHPQNEHLLLSQRKTVKGVLAGILGTKGSTVGGGASGSSKTLDSIAKARKGLALSGSRKAAANQESNKGMRPTRSEGKVKNKGKETPENTNIFKVVSVYILTCGTEYVDDGEERSLELPASHMRIPDKVDVQKGELNGIAVLRDHEGIPLDRTWNHEELCDALAALLPGSFGYFERQQIDDAKGFDHPGWYLATISQRRLRLVPANYPTGAQVDYSKGANTTGWRNNRVWIVSRKPVPKEISHEWASPEAQDFREASESNLKAGGDETDSDEDEDFALPIEPSSKLRRSKRRSIQRNDEEPQKKKRKSSETGIFNDDVAHEIMATLPLRIGPVLPPPKAPTVDPKFSDEYKVDPSWGNPYSDERKYTF